MPDAIDRAVSLTEFIGTVAKVASDVGPYAIPFARLAALAFPWGGTALAVLETAQPYLLRVAAGAPVAAKLIQNGRPVIEAFNKAQPALLDNLKELYAIAVNNDPARPETNLTAADVDDMDVLAFCGPVLFGRRWTNEEMQEYWNRMTVTG